ncbi:phospholipase D-like domain-containing protein [Roseateles sp. UC29_93]|uniref:phospholipase D-like domain-containing protein n=1 Tax=Roseateles sp. UC29_93 TaxID=3350177 RepID=UPI00366D6432
MRKRVSQGGLTVNAIAGSHVVVLGFNVTEAKRKGLRGFAIRRTDHTEDESYWMYGTKTFESVEPHPAPGGQYSSHIHPIQGFQWSDYSAKPGYSYTYKVVAMYGPVDALIDGVSVEVSLMTERIEDEEHVIRFNRGSVATQEYARRFQNLPPLPVKEGGPSAGQAALDWLSRGLFEGIIEFIQRATGPDYGLKGCFYEFQWKDVLYELRKAKGRGADVGIVFDDIDNASGPHARNEAAITTAKIKSLTKPRRNGTLMHNKFLVLTKDGAPIAVLFGSTNLTLNGLFGHANCTHVVENADIAARYLDFYLKLHTDPETTKGSTYKRWTIEQTPAPAEEFVDGMAPVFSPRANSDALGWYGELAGAAKDALFMTFAFGMNDVFRKVYSQADDVLRIGLMEKEWNGAKKEEQIAAIREIQALPNVVIAIGNRIPLNGFDQWLGELERIEPSAHVLWIHLKFMLIDPLSNSPTVVAGSANFSQASTTTNDENMLVIKGNTRVADIYLGEYMRLYSHYAFREAVAIFLRKNPNAKPSDMRQGFLIEEDDWTKDAFNPADTTARRARRLYFAGMP